MSDQPLCLCRFITQNWPLWVKFHCLIYISKQYAPANVALLLSRVVFSLGCSSEPKWLRKLKIHPLYSQSHLWLILSGAAPGCPSWWDQSTAQLSGCKTGYHSHTWAVMLSEIKHLQSKGTIVIWKWHRIGKYTGVTQCEWICKKGSKPSR